jgi:hypothetical protein
MFVENSSYYLVGIQPASSAADGRFRRLDVKVRRPDAEVRTRAGYYAPKAVRPGPHEKAAPTALDRAFGAALPSGTLPLAVTGAPFALGNGRRAAIALTVAAWTPVGDSVTIEKLDVRAVAFDEDFKPRATHRQSVELTLRPYATGERRVELHSQLAVPPGRYEVRVAAEASQSTGGVFLQVDVPDFRKSALSLSGLVLGRPRSGTSDALADLLPVVPTASRAFSPAGSLLAFLRVYQGGKDALRPVHVRARLVDAAGRTALEEQGELGADRFGPERSADIRFPLPLARLQPGPYLVTFDVADAGRTARRDVRFTIEER